MGRKKKIHAFFVKLIKYMIASEQVGSLKKVKKSRVTYSHRVVYRGPKRDIS